MTGSVFDWPFQRNCTEFSKQRIATYLFNPRGEVLNEQLAEVVQCLQLFGLGEQEEHHYVRFKMRQKLTLTLKSRIRLDSQNIYKYLMKD